MLIYNIQRPAEAHSPQRPTEAHRGPQRPTEAHRGPQRPTEDHRGPPRSTEAHRGPQRPTEAHRVLVMLIVLARLLIHVIVISMFDWSIDITTYSIVTGTGNCIVHNRSHNHFNSDGNYSITIISIYNYITNCYLQQHSSIAMTMTITMTMTCIEIVTV